MPRRSRYFHHVSYLQRLPNVNSLTQFSSEALVHAKGNRSAPFVLKELQEIKEFVEFEARNKDVSYLELIKPNMIYRLHVGVFTQIWSQLTGMNFERLDIWLIRLTGTNA
jgi:hypothetical protein